MQQLDVLLILLMLPLYLDKMHTIIQQKQHLKLLYTIVVVES